MANGLWQFDLTHHSTTPIGADIKQIDVKATRKRATIVSTHVEVFLIFPGYGRKSHLPLAYFVRKANGVAGAS
jgi:hypothetical protein